MHALRSAMLLLAATWFLVGCSESNLAGGSGTEAGNGLKIAAVDPQGRPVAGARVEVRPAGSRETASAFVDITSGDGTSRMEIPPGSWAILVRKDSLAFWMPSNGSGLVRDTLRPTSHLVGILEGGSGARISAMGLGNTVECDTNGYFQIDDIPSGLIPLGIVATDAVLESSLEVAPGIHALTLARLDSLPSRIQSIASDSLIPWYQTPLPASLPAGALGDSGQFSVTVRLHRQSLASSVWAISLLDTTGKGVRVGWRGSDSFVLEVDGNARIVPGIPLGLQATQVGLSWDGSHIDVWLDTNRVISYAHTAKTLERRLGWSSPVFGSMGVRQLDWVAFKRGELVADWQARLFLR